MQSGGRQFQREFIAWLTHTGAAQTLIPELLDSFCRFLTAEGFAIYRCNLATDMVHPQMTGLRHVWYSEEADPGPINPAVLVERRQYRIGAALIDEVFFNANSQKSAQYKASPFFQVEKRGELYERILPKGKPQAYPLFEDLAEKGCTAYFGMVLKSFAGMLQKIGLSTSRPGGLTGRQVHDLRWAIALLTLHLNTLVEFSIKNTLARVYLGGDPGKRVSGGMIAVGNVVSLEGAIWFSDLRGFTETSERLDSEDLIQTLNDYFDRIVPPIYANGGEVLKYIGDAVLAVFPTANFADSAATCQSALRAVADAQSRLAAKNDMRKARGEAPLRHGIGLHYGEAQYGNVGSSDRLDFTLIGREVNIASRIEALTKELGESLLCSQAFALASKRPMLPVGAHKLKGVLEEVSIYKLSTPSEQPPSKP
jgi:adenylate cyclase